MTTPSGFYSVAEIEAAVKHLKTNGRHNRQAEENPDLAALVEEIHRARRAGEDEEETT